MSSDQTAADAGRPKPLDAPPSPQAHNDAPVGFWGDVYGSIVNTFVNQANGAIQLNNRLSPVHLEELKQVKVDDPNNSWSAWGASLAGQSIELAAGIFAVGKIGGVARAMAGTSSAEAVITGTECATTQFNSSLGTGALMGSVATPTNDSEHFWTDRFKNMVSSTVTLGTMSGVGLGLQAQAEKIGSRALASTLRNGFVNNAAGGFVGGTLGDITSSALNLQAPDMQHVLRSGAEFALVGMGTHGLNVGTAAAHNAAREAGIYKGIASGWDHANMALGNGVPLKRYLNYYGDDSGITPASLSTPFSDYRVHLTQTSGAPRIDHASERIYLPPSETGKTTWGIPLADQPKLAHELGHGPLDRTSGSSLSQPEYIGWRLSREVNARMAETDALRREGRHEEAAAIQLESRRILNEQTGAGKTYAEQYNSDFIASKGDQSRPFTEYKGAANDRATSLKADLTNWQQLGKQQLAPLFDAAVESHRYADQYVLGVLAGKYRCPAAPESTLLANARRFENAFAALDVETKLQKDSATLSAKEFKLLDQLGQLSKGKANVEPLFAERGNVTRQMAQSIVDMHYYSRDGLSLDNPQLFQTQAWISDEVQRRSAAREENKDQYTGQYFKRAQALLDAGMVDETTARKVGAISDGLQVFNDYDYQKHGSWPSWVRGEALFGSDKSPAIIAKMLDIPGLENWQPTALGAAYQVLNKSPNMSVSANLANLEAAKDAWAVDPRLPLGMAKQVGAASLSDRIAASTALDRLMQTPEFDALADKMQPAVKFEMRTAANRRTVAHRNSHLREESEEIGARRALDSGKLDSLFGQIWNGLKASDATPGSLVEQMQAYTGLQAATQLLFEDTLSPQQRNQLVNIAKKQRNVYGELASSRGDTIGEVLGQFDRKGIKVIDKYQAEDRDHEVTTHEAWAILKNWSTMTPQQKALPIADLLKTAQTIQDLQLSPDDAARLDRTPQFQDWLAGTKDDQGRQEQPAGRIVSVLRTWAELSGTDAEQFGDWLNANYPGKRGAEPYVDKVVSQWTKFSEAEKAAPLSQQIEASGLFDDLTPRNPLSANLMIPHAIADTISALRPWEQIAAIKAWRDQANERFGPLPWDRQWPTETPNPSEWNAAVTSPEWRLQWEKRFDDLRQQGRMPILNGSDDAHRILQTYAPKLEPAFLQMISSAFTDTVNPAQYIQRIQPEQYKEVLSRLIGDKGPETLQRIASLDPVEAATDNFVRFNSNRQSWENDSAIKLLTTFGKQWERWLDVQARPKTDKEGTVTFEGRNAHDATVLLPMAEPADAQSISQWLFRFHDRPADEIGVVARRWSKLTPEERAATYKDTISAARKYVYDNRLDDNFAAEAAKWGVPDQKYASFEKRYLDSMDRPVPFPLDKVWSYEPDASHPNGLTARFLPRNDPRGLFIGQHTNCCQHPLGVGEGAAWYGQESPNAGFFVVEDANKNIVAASLAWKAANGGLVFDSIESKGSGNNEPIVAKLYEQAARDLSTQYRTINVGAGTYAGRRGVDINRWPGAAIILRQIDKDIYTDAQVQRTIPIQ